MHFITTGSTYDFNRNIKWFSSMQINSLLYTLLIFSETPWWWLQARPIYVGDYQYAVKYILPKYVGW